MMLCAGVGLAESGEEEKAFDPGRALVNISVDRSEAGVAITVLPRAVAICANPNTTDCQEDRVTWALTTKLEDREYVVVEPKMSREATAARESNAELARARCFPNKPIRLDNDNPRAVLALPRAHREEICSDLPFAWFYGVKLCTTAGEEGRDDQCDEKSEIDPGVIIDRGRKN
jgi:hypothetical protein